jgi:hypothetical protein
MGARERAADERGQRTRATGVDGPMDEPLGSKQEARPPALTGVDERRGREAWPVQ